MSTLTSRVSCSLAWEAQSESDLDSDSSILQSWDSFHINLQVRSLATNSEFVSISDFPKLNVIPRDLDCDFFLNLTWSGVGTWVPETCLSRALADYVDSQSRDVCIPETQLLLGIAFPRITTRCLSPERGLPMSPTVSAANSPWVDTDLKAYYSQQFIRHKSTYYNHIWSICWWGKKGNKVQIMHGYYGLELMSFSKM